MRNCIMSLICLSALLVGHIGLAMEPCILQQKQYKEDRALRKKIAEFNVQYPVIQEASFPEELQLSIASSMIRDFLCDTATDVRESCQLGDSSYGKLCLAEISHNDQQLVTVHEPKDDIVYIWNMATAQLLHTLEGYGESIYSVTISPNDEYVVASLANGVVDVRGMATGICKHRIPLLTDYISLATVTRDNSFLVTVSSLEGVHNFVRIWSMETGELIGKINHKDNHCILSLATCSRCYQLITNSCNFLCLWDMKTGSLVRTLAQRTFGQDLCEDIAITSDDNYVIGGRDTQVKRWDTKTGQEFSFEAHETNIKALFISLDNTKLITIAFDGIIKVWDMENWSLLHMFDSGHICCVPRLYAVDGYGKIFLKPLADKSVKICDIETGDMHYLQGHADEVGVLKINSDGTQIVTGSSAKVAKDMTTKIWSLKKSPARLWLENQILPFQANLVARIYAVNKAKKNFEIYSGTDDMLLWVSLPSHVRDYLKLYLKIALVSQTVQIHQ